MSKLKTVAVFLAATIMAPAAMAFDATGATTYISGDMTLGIVAIGGALLLLAATAVGFKWGKGMIFS